MISLQSGHLIRIGPLGCWVLLILLLGPFHSVAGQGPASIRVQTGTGPMDPGLSVFSHGGFPAVAAQELGRLGWAVEENGERVLARWSKGGLTVEIRPGSPFLTWGGQGVHLAEAPYVASGQVFLPLQFFIDILPWKLPDVFRYDPDTRTLQFLASTLAEENGSPPVHVIVIDPGHGGRDPGTRGPAGTREKEVALVIGRALARILEDEPNTRVYLTRDADTLIPLWKRGELATDWRGDGIGVFISIHANAMPNSRATRGFETYFLSEARTEHERRTEALENSAQEFETAEEGPQETEDLSSILIDLRRLDHEHWSALLAEMVQNRLAQFHPGPNRGVKQSSLAVLTNALMPGVLVEVGFLTNPEEERLLKQEAFQEDSALAIAEAVREFLRRYPGGGGS